MTNRKYTINLMWIGRMINPNQQYILPNINILANTINNWIKYGHNVNVWYDSEMATKNQIENTKIMVNNMIDIRVMNQVEENVQVFSDKIPVYFRADLLRTMAAVHYLEQTGADYYVYADLDVVPMSKDELFDEKTLKNLGNAGIVLAKNDTTKFENSFQIIANKPNVFTALKHAIIDLNVARAYNAINGKFREIGTNNSPIKSLSESVFYSYMTMSRYLYHLNGDGILYKVLSWDDVKKFGFDADVDDEIFSYHLHKHCFNSDYFCKTTLATNLYYSSDKKLKIPTKRIISPPPQGNYDKYLPDSESPWYRKLFNKFF